MKIFQSWIKVITIFLISSIAFYANGEEKRFDFEVHQGHFINGEFDTSVRNHKYKQVFELTFKDGCAVKFDSDMNTGRASLWRWSKRNVHGRMMKWTKEFEKT